MAEAGGRVRELDALRGFAMCGIVFVNIVQMSGMSVGPRDAARNTAGLVYDLLAYQRFFPIFSFLFGVSFALFLDGAAQRDPRPRLVLLRRLVVLGAIGVLHSLLQADEVLRWYAAAGLLFLLPASYLPRAWMLLVAGLVLLVPGVLFGGAFVIPALLLLGFAAGRTGLAWMARTRLLAVVFGLGLVGSVLGGIWQAAGGVGLTNRVRSLPVGLVFALTLATGFLLLLRTPLRTALDAVFERLGRMALTNYLLATVLILVGIRLLDLGSETELRTVLLLGLAIGAVQAVLSQVVLRRWRYGPAEWAWRCLTWWTVVPLRRPSEEVAA